MKKQTLINIVLVLCSLACFVLGGYGYREIKHEQKNIVKQFMQDEIPSVCSKHGMAVRSVNVFGVEKSGPHSWAAFADISGTCKSRLWGNRKFKRLYRVEITTQPGETNSVIKLTTDF